MSIVILIIMCVCWIAITVFAIFYNPRNQSYQSKSQKGVKKENEKATDQARKIQETTAQLNIKPNDMGFDNALKLLHDLASKQSNKLPPNGSNTL